MEKEFQKVQVVVAVVIKQDGKYLLVQERKEIALGLWNLPAGRVNIGESLEHAAVREAKEETGYNVHLIRKINIIQDAAGDSIKHIFEAEITGGELRIPRDELLDVRWFTYGEVANMQDKIRNTWPFQVLTAFEQEGK